jgi:hypothetical protein
MEGRSKDLHPWEIASPLGNKIYPWGSKFAPRGEIKNPPLGVLQKELEFFSRTFSSRVETSRRKNEIG